MAFSIIPPQVPFVDPRTGTISREWYQFLLNVFKSIGSGQTPISVDQFQTLLATARGTNTTGLEAAIRELSATVQMQRSERAGIETLRQRMGELEAMVSGQGGKMTLPIPPSSGGTGTATAFATGSIPFADTSGNYQQDNSNLKYDSVNYILSVPVTLQSPTLQNFTFNTGTGSTGTSSATGASATMVAESSTASGGQGGNLTLKAGAGGSGGIGGQFSLVGGQSSGTGSVGGNLAMSGGNAATGGTFQINGGSGVGTSAVGGAVAISAGSALSAGGSGGSIRLSGGNGSFTAGATYGGYIQLTGGSATGGNTGMAGGKISLQPGKGNATALYDGDVEIKDARGNLMIQVTSTNQLGFFATTPTTQPTITGSRGGNAALASLLTGLAGLGLIVDATTA